MEFSILVSVVSFVLLYFPIVMIVTPQYSICEGVLLQPFSICNGTPLCYRSKKPLVGAEEYVNILIVFILFPLDVHLLL